MAQQARRTASIMLGCLLAVWASGAPAQERPSSRAAATESAADISPTQLKDLFATYREIYRTLFFTGTKQDCSTTCSVQITLKTTNVDGKDFCIATMPEELTFASTGPGNSPKVITWTLSTSTLLGRTVEFHNDHGILKVDDGKQQIVPDPHRTSPMVFEGTNKHKLKGSFTYVPVVLFRTAQGVPELCAAGDPKIVND